MQAAQEIFPQYLETELVNYQKKKNNNDDNSNNNNNLVDTTPPQQIFVWIKGPYGYAVYTDSTS